MNTLVVHSSRHGGTRGIAERIAATLREQGIQVDVRSVDDRPDPGAYRAVVLGSAVYYGKWMKEATSFAAVHRETLAGRSVWLFSSGPTGTEMRPEHSALKDAEDVRAAVGARDHRVFFGAIDPDELNFKERLIVRGVKAPVGDFRDWDQIECWAKEIATYLNAMAA
jgi:menaquinone-dependent protoporphyrinogen oxidase